MASLAVLRLQFLDAAKLILQHQDLPLKQLLCFRISSSTNAVCGTPVVSTI